MCNKEIKVGDSVRHDTSGSWSSWTGEVLDVKEGYAFVKWTHIDGHRNNLFAAQAVTTLRKLPPTVKYKWWHVFFGREGREVQLRQWIYGKPSNGRYDSYSFTDEAAVRKHAENIYALKDYKILEIKLVEREFEI